MQSVIPTKKFTSDMLQLMEKKTKQQNKVYILHKHNYKPFSFRMTTSTFPDFSMKSFDCVEKKMSFSSHIEYYWTAAVDR